MATTPPPPTKEQIDAAVAARKDLAPAYEALSQDMKSLVEANNASILSSTKFVIERGRDVETMDVNVLINARLNNEKISFYTRNGGTDAQKAAAVAVLGDVDAYVQADKRYLNALKDIGIQDSRDVYEQKAFDKKIAELKTPAAPAAPAPAENNTDALAETAKRVQSGAIIRMGGTSPKDEDARKAVAEFLQESFAFRDDTLLTKYGLGDSVHLSLMDDDGSIKDRKLLDRAFRYFQEAQGLVPDGKLGTDSFTAISVFDDRPHPVKHFVTQTAHLGGRTHSYEALEKAVADVEDPQVLAYRRAKKVIGKMVANVSYEITYPGSTLSVQEKAVLAKLSGAEEKDLSSEVQAAMGKLDRRIVKIDTSDGLSKDEVKALQVGFGLKGKDGVIGTETASLIEQISLRLHTQDVLDPSDLRQAAQAPYAGRKPKQGQSV